MTQREMFKQWANYAAAAIEQGQWTELDRAMPVLDDLLGRNQNPDCGGDDSFTDVQWETATLAYEYLDGLLRDRAHFMKVLREL